MHGLPDGIAGLIVAAALASAFLHAAWNAGVKASADPGGAMAAQIVGSGLASVPILIFVPPPSLAALPWLCGSAVFGFLAFFTLLRGYQHGGGYGFVYPLARATSPPLLLFIANAAQGETVSATGIIGIALVSAGVALFALGEGRQRLAAMVFALLAGAFSAGYALCDANGARNSPSVLGYGLAVSIVNGAVFGSFHKFRTGIAIAKALRTHLVMATFGVAAGSLSYFLILWVWSRAPVAIGSALRDTSVVFAALIAARLGEGLSPQRLCAIALVTSGACVIRFA
jgi:drug/metabolite transporter (DMT)-like permease